ncbi:phosphotransferase [bacterium]|nr:phosphotransferase [bacterium]
MSEYPDFLETLLSRSPNIDVSKLKGDVSTRRYFRLRFAEPGNARDFVNACLEIDAVHSGILALPDECESAIVAMLLPPGGAARYARAILDIAGYLESCAVPIPKNYIAIYDLGFLLIEDLGDARFCELAPEMSDRVLVDTYRKAISSLISMQFPTAESFRSCLAHSYSFTEKRFLWELDFFVENFTRLAFKREPRPDEREIFATSFPIICREMMRQPMVFTHRDYHSRNLMIKNDRLCIIDFQDARLGPITYDIVSLLFDPYVTLRQEMRQELIDHYMGLVSPAFRAKLRQLGVSRSIDASVVQRCLKAAGTYSYQAAENRNSEYSAFIAPAIESAISAASHSVGLTDLKNLLTRWLSFIE